MRKPSGWTYTRKDTRPVWEIDDIARVWYHVIPFSEGTHDHEHSWVRSWKITLSSQHRGYDTTKTIDDISTVPFLPLEKKPCVCPQTDCSFKNKVCTICQYKVFHIKRNQVSWKRRAREKKEDIFCLRDENARTWKKKAKSENNLNSHTQRNGAKHEKLGFRHPLLYLPQDSRRYIYFQR